jgi:hypothetical protein
VIRFLRDDYRAQGETPPCGGSNVGGFPTKELFALFPKKPAKKMSYVAGCPSPSAACERGATTMTTIQAPVPTSTTTPSTGRKLAIICSKGSLDMAYPGLILANAALGEGIETHLFFTFWGFDIINKKTMGTCSSRPSATRPRTCRRPLGPARHAGVGDQMMRSRSPLDVPPCPSSST